MTLLEDAVRANVAWCALVSGGPGTEPRPGCWLAPPGPPPRYPDLVTPRPGVAAADVADSLRHRPVSSVKDSHADVDLTDAGFRVLFGASWIGRSATGPAAIPDGWTPVTSATGLVDWCAAAGLPAPLPSRVLGTRELTVLARHRGGRLDGGAITHRRHRLVDLGNVFGTDPWPDLLRIHAEDDVVGYEHGDDLAAACAAGLAPLGPLRIWVRESPSGGPAGATARPAC